MTNISLFHYICLMVKYYRHFKGGIYKFIGIAKDSETLEDRVVYQSISGEGQLWTWPKDMFFEDVERDGIRMPRFKELDEDEVKGMGQ